MQNFARALAFTLQWEGGYSDNPADHGGATMKGITQATYDAWRKAHDLPVMPVKGITTVELQSIYHHNYWDACECDSLPTSVAIAVFDAAVNSGPSRSIKLLQKACGGLTVDGAIGPKTLAAAQTVSVGHVIDQREGWYHAIVANDATQSDS